MKDILKDVVKHTHGLGIINAVKVTTDADTTSVDAMDDDRTVVLRGKLHSRVSDFNGKFGLGRLGVLSGYLNFSTFDAIKSEEASTNVAVRREERNGEIAPTELDFTAPGGFAASYRVISSAMVDEQIKTANFKGAKWDVEFVPSRRAVKELQQVAGILSSYDPLFTVSTEDDNLIFTIGDASTDKADLQFAKNVGGSLSSAWSFPLSTVLTILRLGDTSQMSVKISDQGAMMIAVDSGLGLYEYILPAKAGN
jgi:hypothetical protein